MGVLVNRELKIKCKFHKMFRLVDEVCKFYQSQFRLEDSAIQVMVQKWFVDFNVFVDKRRL